MKIFLLLFCSVTLFSCADTGIKNKIKQNKPTQDITQKHDSTYYADSIYYANLELDSLVYDLKGEYKLYLYPTNGNRQHSLKLIGNNIDTIFERFPIGTEKYISYYDGIDFDKYFIIKSGATASIYDKTGKSLLKFIYIGSYSIKNNLLAYLSEEDDEGLMLLNLNNLKKVDIYNYITETSPYMGSSFAYQYYYVNKITGKYIIIWFTLGQNEEDGKLIEIKIPIDKIM